MLLSKRFQKLPLTWAEVSTAQTQDVSNHFHQIPPSTNSNPWIWHFISTLNRLKNQTQSTTIFGSCQSNTAKLKLISIIIPKSERNSVTYPATTTTTMQLRTRGAASSWILIQLTNNVVRVCAVTMSVYPLPRAATSIYLSQASQPGIVRFQWPTMRMQKGK